MNKSGLSEFNYMPVSDIFPGVHLFLAVAVLLHSMSVWGQVAPFWTGILNVWVLLRQRGFLWAFMPHCFKHFPNSFTWGTLMEKLLCEMQVKKIVSYCPQLSPQELRKTEYRYPQDSVIDINPGKGLILLVSRNLGADRRLKREDGPWSLLIIIKI